MSWGWAEFDLDQNQQQYCRSSNQSQIKIWFSLHSHLCTEGLSKDLFHLKLTIDIGFFFFFFFVHSSQGHEYRMGLLKTWYWPYPNVESSALLEWPTPANVCYRAGSEQQATSAPAAVHESFGLNEQLVAVWTQLWVLTWQVAQQDQDFLFMSLNQRPGWFRLKIL